MTTAEASKRSSAQRNNSARHDHMGPLTAFAVHPDGLRFETQEDTEEIILFLRQHLIVLLPTALIGVVLVIAPTIIIPFLLRFLTLPISIPAGYVVVGTVTWYVLTFGFLLSKFLRWFFNIYIVSNERLVDIDFVNLLYKEFSEARLDKIQDLSYTSRGILAALFNYGTVHVQTAGEMPNFSFDSVPNPEEVIKTIGDLAESVSQKP